MTDPGPRTPGPPDPGPRTPDPRTSTQPADRGLDERPRTIDELCDRFLAWADGYYRRPPDPRTGVRHPTGETANLRSALRYLRAFAGDRDPRTFTAEDLAALRDRLLDRPAAEQLTRAYINRIIGSVRRAFWWAARPGQRFVGIEVPTDLRLLPDLTFGRTAARESADIEPVPEEHFRATLDHLAELSTHPRRWRAALTLSQALQVHWLTGMRPGELVRISYGELRLERVPPGLLSGARDVMIYRPARHKTAHHGHIRRIILPPEAQRIVEDRRPWVASPTGRLWSYSTASYRTAVRRICEEAGVPVWSPNQIRHAFATRMREKAGINIVQIALGHRHISTTEIYAEPAMQAAIEAIFRHA